jgi:SPP1 gp7 family putative phage head morphogenesis protein
MSIFNKIYNYFNPIFQRHRIKLTTDEKNVRKLEVLPGNTAAPTDSYGTVIGDIPMYQRDEFEPSILLMLGNLAVHHPKVSLAISNIKLANTKYQIYFDETIAPRKQRQMRSHIEAKMNEWYVGGNDVILDTIFFQLAVKGCISIDRIINKNLSGIDRIEFINPYTIRWVRKGNEKPYLVQLNNLDNFGIMGTPLGKTYSYIPLQLTDTSLYGVPFLLSVIDSVAFENEMWKSFKTILRKVGIAGLYKVLVDAPEQQDGEADDVYEQRVQKYLQDTYKAVQRSSANGIVVGLKNQYEMEIENANSNANGVESFFKIINLITYQSLKQDPNMMGESYTVSEAFTKVVLKKMAQQYRAFQQRVATWLEETILLELTLAGYSPRSVTIEFEEAMPEDRLLAEQITEKQISNMQKLFADGIISKQQYAERLGYSQPYIQDEPQQFSFTATKAKFDYSIPKECLAYAGFPDRKQNQFAKDYINAAEKLYNDFIDDFGKACKSVLKKEYKSFEALEKAILDKLANVGGKSFIGNLKDICTKHVSNSYDYFRKDKRVFGTKFNFDFVPPDPTSNFLDQRVIDYLIAADIQYLGNIITDPEMVTRLTQLLRAYYEGDTDIADLVQEVTNDLQNVLQLEQWKITRVINTTMNKVRTNANLLYMQQAKVEKYTIIEVNDRLTCPHCKVMNGKEFFVKKSVANLINELENGLDDLPPFATSVGIDDFRNLTEEQLADRGFSKPPFHCHCRGVLGAIV